MSGSSEWDRTSPESVTVRRSPQEPADGGVDRRNVLKFGAGGVAVLGGGWLLYDSVLGNDLTAEEQAAKEVVRENVRALENEDMDAMKATLHPESPKYSQTVEGMRSVFQQYDLTYDLEIESVEVDGEEARVEAVQTTRKESGPAFRDNKMWATHVLRKYEGEWRIYDTIVEDVEYLN